MTMQTPPIVSAEEWQTAWEQLLVEEKQLFRARDALAAKRGGCRGWRSSGTTASTVPTAR